MLDPDFQDPIRYTPDHKYVVVDTGHHGGFHPPSPWYNYMDRVKPLEPERYFMDLGWDGKFYIVHVDMREKWNDFWAEWSSNEPVPEWASRVTNGIENVTFERPEGA